MNFKKSNGTPTNQDNELQSLKRKTRITLLIVIMVFIGVISAFAAYFVWNNSQMDEVPMESDNTVFDGTLENMDPDEVRALLQDKVDKSQFAFEINSRPSFPKGTLKAGNLRIQNPPQNQYNMVVIITDDETGKELFKSTTIKPLQYIEYAPLKERLASGKHPATATFKAYNDKGGYVGEVAAEVTIYAK